MNDLAPGVRACLLAALTVMLCGLRSLPVLGQTGGADAPTKRERDAVHFTDALRANDPKLTDTIDGALDSLEVGHDVVILFDGRSVTALRMNRRRATTTDLEALAIPPEQQSAVATRLGLPAAQAPRNHLELVQRLVDKGARVFVNRDAVRLYGLSDREIHPIATSISARQMAELLETTDLCYTYRH